MTDEALIERVARAIAPEAWAEDAPVPTRGDVVAFHERRQASVAKARAALAAIREGGYEVVPVKPTEAMIIDGTNARMNTGLSTYNETPSMWRAMIAAAGKET